VTNAANPMENSKIGYVEISKPSNSLTKFDTSDFMGDIISQIKTNAHPSVPASQQIAVIFSFFLSRFSKSQDQWQ